MSIPAGSFRMGDPFADGHPGDGEGPVHTVTTGAFEIDTTAVTNAALAAFVDATGYRTESERFGSSAVFHLAVRAAPEEVLNQVTGAPWWFGVRGADWRHPDLDPSDGWRTNIWQGRFPVENTLDDGWLTTAPVRSYPANGLGLYETVGNVWEWCADWFDPRWYGRSPAADPTGPATGTTRVMRGGSYLCHDSYCNRYRNAARTSNTPDSASGNNGFRSVRPVLSS